MARALMPFWAEPGAESPVAERRGARFLPISMVFLLSCAVLF
jgi:hypothetical protein